MDIFFIGLTEDTIDRAITSFTNGISSRKVLPTDFDPRRAQLTCDRILRLTTKGSTAIGLVYDIPKFWINLAGLVRSSDLNAIESQMTRVFCMQGSLRFHRWLQNIVPTAIGHTRRNNWLDQLARDVEIALDLKKSATFSSINYLPNLAFHREYIMETSAFRYARDEILNSTISSILRHWLHFPSDGVTLVQLSLIDIITSKSPTSILFLDKIWDMYQTPFSTVFNNWNRRTSKQKINASLLMFEKKFSSHPFATPGSLAYKKLNYLSRLITHWIENSDINSTTSTVSLDIKYIS